VKPPVGSPHWGWKASSNTPVIRSPAARSITSCTVRGSAPENPSSGSSVSERRTIAVGPGIDVVSPVRVSVTVPSDNRTVTAKPVGSA
jgi:hypothetical protein